MIYTRYGSAIHVIRNCGRHQPAGFITPVHLVLVAYNNNPRRTRYYFAETLKADAGTHEIDARLSEAPTCVLGPDTLAAALKEAE